VRIRQHVNPLKSDLLDIADVPRVAAAPGQALEVELGAAEAHFLIDRARLEPDTSFVGVEIRRELVEAVNAACAADGPANVRSVFANMSVDMSRLFADASVRRFFLNFPDPWFKKRHKKRRVVNPDTALLMKKLLRPSGEVHVMTDYEPIGIDIRECLDAAGFKGGPASASLAC